VIYSRLKRLKRVRTKRSGSNKIVFKNSEREEEKEGEASFGGDFDLMSAVLSAFLKNSLAAARVSSACSPFCWLQMNLDLL
jgi:hypothetical protein